MKKLDNKEYNINLHDLAEWLTEQELKKTNLKLAKELFETRGKDFCVGLILHLIMYISGNYTNEK